MQLEPPKKEAYAIVSALRKYETCIGNNPISVITDHKSLGGWVSEHLDTPSGPRGRRGRWHETFSKFNLSVLYLPGKDNEVADALSRWAYSGCHAWQDVSGHGSLQDKLEHKAIVAEEKQAEATCVYTISGTEPRPVYGCPTLSQVLESLLPPNMVREEHCDQCSALNDVVLQCNSCFINTLITRRQKRMYTNTVASAAAVALIAGQMAALSQATSPPSNNHLSTEVHSPSMSQSHNHPGS